MSTNTITITGNLVADPETTTFESGKAVTRATVAYNETITTGDGDKEVQAFVDLAIWNGQGERAAFDLRKGDRIIVTGKLQTRSFERQDGSRGKQVEVLVAELGASLKFDHVVVDHRERVAATV